MESDERQQQRFSPPPPLSPLLAQPPSLLNPTGLHAALLAQLAVQHASQLQYQQALLTWARLASGGLPPPPPPLLADRGEPGDLAAAPSSLSASSESPPRSDGSPPVRPTRKAASRAKVFTCPICGRSFGYKHVLQNHVRTHTGEKPFQCSQCQKRFTRDHHLKTHMRLHTGEKPYQCVQCSRRFVQVANLRRHMRVHTGERPNACQHCTARFSDSNQLRNHELVHTGQKPFGCAVCGADFRRRYQLTQHRCVAPRVGLTTVAAAVEEAQRLGQKLSEALLRQRPVDALNTGTTAGLIAGVKTEPQTEREPEPEADMEMEVKLEPGPVIGTSFSLGTGLGAGLERELLPEESSQTEPEDLSVSTSRWSSGSLDGQCLSSALILNPTGVTSAGDNPETEEKTSHQRWPSGPAEHGRRDGGMEDAQRRRQTSGEFVPWWDPRERHRSKPDPESESGKPSTSPQDLPAVAWPLHPGQQEPQVFVYPEEQQRSSAREWEQLVRTGSDRPEVIRSQTTPDRSPAPLRASADGEVSPRRRGGEDRPPSADRSWPWNLSLADARRCLPEEKGGGHRDTSASSPEVSVIDLQSSDEEEEEHKQWGTASVSPSRHLTADEDEDGTEDKVPSARGRRALPRLVPLWIPPQSSVPRKLREDGKKTAEEEDTGSALLKLLAAPSSPPPAEYPWSQGRTSSQGYNSTAEHGKVTEKEQRGEEQRRGGDVGDGYSWGAKEERRPWENRDEKRYLKDGVEIELWEGVKG